MPDRSEYQPLAQSVEDEEDVGDGLPSSSAPRRGLRRSSRPRHIDLSKLDTAFKRWTESIARKVRSKKKKAQDHSRKEIWHSVFEPAIPPVPGDSGTPKTLDHKPPMTDAEFDALVQGIKQAVLAGIHPKMISKGSSGSYFARVKQEGKVQIVAVFKPKDEEPYGRLNPKTTKWLHRQFKWIIPFGRACLIPNLSYISEAAASLLDQRLNLFIVPRTELVSLSSSAFFYDWIDRSAAKKGKQLPEKIGSLQCFLSGYTDASDFLRKNPFPGRAIAETYDENMHRHRNVAKRFLNTLRVICGRTGEEEEFYDEEERENDRRLFDVSESPTGRPFYWTTALQDSFREELEKLVILDSLMLNTDRGLDNFMIKYCESDHEKALVDVAPSRNSHVEMSELGKSPSNVGTSIPSQGPSMPSSTPYGHSAPEASSAYNRQPHIHIAAIDNSLSFPHEHPRGWRSYTYGWLYLPVSIIGRPFSEKTRNHFLPLLTSKFWWEETSYQLRQLFALDPDFHPKMFRKQLAVIKGQALNIVQSLKHADEGPLELTRRRKVLVWDDEVESADEQFFGREVVEEPEPLVHEPASPHASINTMPLPPQSARMVNSRPRGRSHTSASGFPIRRSAEMARLTKPVSFSAKYPRAHPAITGVAILEQMERLDQVEASLKKIAVDETIDETDEVDVADSSATPKPRSSYERSSSDEGGAPFSPGASEYLPSVVEVPSSNASVAEEDLVVMSKSMSQLDTSPAALHTRWTSNDDGRRGLDWIVDEAESPKTKTVIVERLETVNANPVFSC